MRYSHVLLALVVILFSMVVEASFKNPAPVFGIVSQPCYPQLAEMGCKDHYINAAYVKWLESAGAKSVIIPHTSTTAEIEEIFGSINGLIFPGGNTDISDPAFHHTLETLYRLAIKSADAGVEIPIWGTCLGMQALAVLSSGDDYSVLTEYDSYYVPLAVNFTTNAVHAHFFDYLSPNGKKEMMDYLSTVPATDNLHHYGVHPSDYTRSPGMREMFRIIGTSLDMKGREFIAMMEARNYPIFAVQFHPERTSSEIQAFENIVTDYEAIRAMHHFAAMLVQRAKPSMAKHAFKNQQAFLDALVYKHQPMYAASISAEEDLQYYVF